VLAFATCCCSLCVSGTLKREDEDDDEEEDSWRMFFIIFQNPFKEAKKKTFVRVCVCVFAC